MMASDRVLSSGVRRGWAIAGLLAVLGGCAAVDPGDVGAYEAALDNAEGFDCSTCVGGECGQHHCFDPHGDTGDRGPREGSGGDGGGGGCWTASCAGEGAGGSGIGSGQSPAQRCADVIANCMDRQDTSCRERPAGGTLVMVGRGPGGVPRLEYRLNSRSAAECRGCKDDFEDAVIRCVDARSCDAFLSEDAVEEAAEDIFGNCNN